jgi:ATP-dependent Zn protease
MKPLDDPSTSKLSTKQSRDEEEQPDRRLNLLQRVALTCFGVFSSLVPTRLRQALKVPVARRLLSIFLMFLLGLIFSISAQFGANRRGTVAGGPMEVVYSDFLGLVQSGNVAAVRFDDSSSRILFDLKATSQISSPQKTTKSSRSSKDGGNQVKQATGTIATSIRRQVPRQFYTKTISADINLIPMLLAAGVEFGSLRSSVSAAILRIIATALALWIPLIPLLIIMRRALDGRSGGSGRKRKNDPRMAVPPTTFADVAGVGAAKEELTEVVACLRDSTKYSRLGAKLPSGVLLCGPPGTGKTLLARAVAGEAGVPFIAVSASEFVEMFVGRGAARIRELFGEARKQAPCVVFIDELDAVGGRRGAGLNEERDQTLNQLLTELDGFEGRPGVLLLAATNRPEVLDPALLRPGRLSRKVVVPLPDEEGRAAVLAVHLRGVSMEEPHEDPVANHENRMQICRTIAKLTVGFSGAELQNVVNEAAFLAVRQNAHAVTIRELVEGVSRTRYGVNGVVGGGGGLSGVMQRWLQGIASGMGDSGQRVRSQPVQ